MTTELWAEVDEYFSGLFLPKDVILESALAASDAGGLPTISVSPMQGKLLYMLAKLNNATTILELGTLGGYSTIWLARALSSDGRLITLEYSPKHAEVAAANIANAGLSEKVEIRVGAALDTLPVLAAENPAPFDVIFIDADKDNYPGYFEWAMKLSRPGTLIVLDNVVRQGSIIESDSDDPGVQGVRRAMELVAAESRVTSTVIQNVGSKGYDGLALVIVEK
jgi:predicted O-methyltransferase YrrM